MKEIGLSKKSMSTPEPAILFSFGRGKCPQTGSNCGFIRRTCKLYCWLKQEEQTMVTLLLGLIACILLFGPVGLGVFAVIMICFLPFCIVHYFTRMIFGHKRKYHRRDKVVVETQRGKVTLLYKDGRWVVDNQKPRIS